MLNKPDSTQSMKQNILGIWLLFGTASLLPVYFEGTRSILFRVFGTTLNDRNTDWLSVFATAIMIPIAFGWRVGPKVGASLQAGIFTLLILWSVYFDPAVLTNWLSYALKLGIVCVVIAASASSLVWASASRSGRVTKRKFE